MERKTNKPHRYTRTRAWISVFQAMNYTWFLLSRARLCLATDIHHLTWRDPLGEGVSLTSITSVETRTVRDSKRGDWWLQESA